MTSPAPATPLAGAMFADLFDDAGLFPPASLPMDEALAAHRIAQDGGYRWMLARFVVATSRVEELARSAARFGDRLRLALVVDAPVDVERLASTIDEHGWRAESVEMLLNDAEVAARADDVASLAASVGAERPFVELPWADFPMENIADAIAAMEGGHAGLKIRCGGADATAYPSPAVLAAMLAAAGEHRVPVKATAGLHHPFRHPDPDTGVLSHGFVNLLVAAALARSVAAEVTEIAEALTDDDAEAFVFEPDALRWHDHRLSVDDVKAARMELLTAIGTCSFREPVEDLVALHLLPVP
ncbi:MAG TPA: hypothetical protein VM345_17555 [Acidimicrobiales bacterium]|nr:hypothetical protein [Acidimicrobiales bacterium]